ncbi:hypothetical protein HHL28_02110 [Aerophototrophica crusticola]|uniref:Uncharacterized protein n=1 Tax=Aerophototrophica crusticola TaxID=1709002 RepID=A0A858R3V1_9PROT|nr:hypothetical protein HHL28_02110 [Rhodospirillaceae bacterium B3]
MRLTLAACLSVAILAPLAAPAGAQVQPPQRKGEYGCQVSPATPCRGRVDFEQGNSFEFKIAGPGQAVFTNEGNKRCTLEYSVTESSQASTGKQLNLGPGQTLALPVRDKAGMIVRFFSRGLGSTACDLSVTLQG